MHTIEWAAGLFEGEGCITWRDKDHTKPYIKMTMTDFDVVQKFQEVVGSGSTYYVHHSRQNPKWKDQLMWREGNKEQVIRILSAMLPYFGLRRAYKALNILDDLELATN